MDCLDGELMTRRTIGMWNVTSALGTAPNVDELGTADR